LVPSFSGFGTPELKIILFSENSLPQWYIYIYINIYLFILIYLFNEISAINKFLWQVFLDFEPVPTKWHLWQHFFLIFIFGKMRRNKVSSNYNQIIE
jgi:hypothetical protein